MSSFAIYIFSLIDTAANVAHRDRDGESCGLQFSTGCQTPQAKEPVLPGSRRPHPGRFSVRFKGGINGLGFMQHRRHIS